MSFKTEMERIPKVAVILAALVYVAMAAFLWMLPLNDVGSLQHEPLLFKVIFGFGVPLPLAAYVLLVGYIYADAKRRNMRHVMWTWVAALVPNAIGIIFYFVMRDALPLPCPGCTKPVLSSYPFCPHCGFATAPRCAKCGTSVKHGWSNCAFCGTPLQGGSVVKT